MDDLGAKRKEEKMGKDILVASFQKNVVENVKIKLTEYEGEDLIDIRVWVKSQDGSGEIRTPKGLTIRKKLFGELKNGILKLEKAINK